MKYPAYLIFLCLSLLLQASAADAWTDQFYSVRNHTDEEIIVHIYPANDNNSTGTEFRVQQESCAEQQLSFDVSCDNDICARGTASGRDYGCVLVRSCTDAGITFYADQSPDYSAYSGCDEDECNGDEVCWYLDDDDDFETSVAVSCFIRTAAGH